jgi:hypothetical protein
MNGTMTTCAFLPHGIVVSTLRPFSFADNANLTTICVREFMDSDDIRLGTEPRLGFVVAGAVEAGRIQPLVRAIGVDEDWRPERRKRMIGIRIALQSMDIGLIGSCQRAPCLWQKKALSCRMSSFHPTQAIGKSCSARSSAFTRKSVCRPRRSVSII